MTVFLGDNSAGKSTLIQAFMWALYGNDLDLDRPKDILNKEVVQELYTGKKAHASVEIELIHSEIRYVFEKKQEYQCVDIGKVKLIEDPPIKAWIYEGGEKVRNGGETPIQLAEKILPKRLAGYFFFDGEHIEKLYASTNLKNSISSLMGVDPLNQAIKDLDRVAHEFRTSISNSGDEKLVMLSKAYEDAASALEISVESLNNQEDGRNRLFETYKDVEQKFLDNKVTIDIAKQIKEIEQKIETKKKDITDAHLRVSNSFKNSYLNVLSYDLVDDALKFIADQINDKALDEGIPGMNGDSIDNIIERGRCICGLVLESHPEALEHLRREKDYLPPQSIGTELSTFVSRCDEANNKAPALKDAFDNYLSIVFDEYDRLDDLVEKLDELTSHSTNISDAEAKRIAEDYKKYKNAYEKQLGELPRYISRRDLAKRELERTKKDLIAFESENEKDVVPRTCARYADRLIADISRTVDIKEAGIYGKFSQKLEEIFKEMYHGKRVVVVDKDYKVKLLVEGVGETSLSTGTKVIVGFAFVATLLYMAREQLEEDSDIKTEPYPLIMDAPSSDLDSKHISNTFEYISNVAEQIIILMTDKDWEHAKNVLKKRIDKVYRLEKKSDIQTVIKEET